MIYRHKPLSPSTAFPCSPGQDSFQAPSLFGPKPLVLFHIKVITQLWLFFLLFELGLSFPESSSSFLWGQGVQVHGHCEHPSRLPVANVDGGTILLDQEHRIEACVGLPVQASEQGSVAVSPPRGCIQVAAALRGSPCHHTLPQQAKQAALGCHSS